jgi:hypothetical protein
MGLPPRDRTTDRIVAHAWDDTVVGVVPPCLPYMDFGATTGGLPLPDHQLCNGGVGITIK